VPSICPSRSGASSSPRPSASGCHLHQRRGLPCRHRPRGAGGHAGGGRRGGRLRSRAASPARHTRWWRYGNVVVLSITGLPDRVRPPRDHRVRRGQQLARGQRSAPWATPLEHLAAPPLRVRVARAGQDAAEPVDPGSSFSTTSGRGTRRCSRTGAARRRRLSTRCRASSTSGDLPRLHSFRQCGGVLPCGLRPVGRCGSMTDASTDKRTALFDEHVAAGGRMSHSRLRHAGAVLVARRGAPRRADPGRDLRRLAHGRGLRPRPARARFRPALLLQRPRKLAIGGPSTRA